MNLVALPTVAILVKKAIAICPDAKINVLTQIFNKSDAYGGKLRSQLREI